MSLPIRTLIRAAAGAAILFSAAAARAETPPTDPSSPPAQAVLPADKQAWQTWTMDGSCSAIIHVSGPAHEGVQNGDSYIAVKHAPKEHNYNLVTVESGLAGDLTGSAATIEVNGVEFPLLVYGNAGFVRSGKPERELIELFSKSKEATVTWSKTDGLAVQTYDISGFESAKRTIDQACPHPSDPAPIAAAAPKAEAAAHPHAPKSTRHKRRHRR